MAFVTDWLKKGRALLRSAAPATPAPVRVVIIGNCQSGAIAQLMCRLSKRIVVLEAISVDSVLADATETYAASLEAADFIIAQAIKDDYPVAWARRGNLTALYGDKLVFYTNHFFDGYFPELCYLHDPEGQRHVLPGPMADYHYKTVIHAFQQGMSVAEAVALNDDDAFYARHFAGVAERSLAELARREDALDIRIHDYVAGHFRERQLFFTFNHPTSHLLLRSCDAILRRIGVTPEVDHTRIIAGEYLENVSRPVAGPVYREQAMTFDNSRLHKGLDMVEGEHGYVPGGVEVHYSLPELVETFYRLYDRNHERVLKYPINFQGMMG